MQMLCRLRRWLRGLEPRVRGHMDRPWLLSLQPRLEQRALFRFQRQPLARGVAAGMFCGLIPGPLQLPGTLLACAWMRGNVVAGGMTTFYTNPLTIVPLYALAFYLGALVMPGEQVMPAWAAWHPTARFQCRRWPHGCRPWAPRCWWGCPRWGCCWQRWVMWPCTSCGWRRPCSAGAAGSAAARQLEPHRLRSIDQPVSMRAARMAAEISECRNHKNGIRPWPAPVPGRYPTGCRPRPRCRRSGAPCRRSRRPGPVLRH